MLEIKPIFGGAHVAAACSRAGIQPGAGCYLYRATDGDTLLAQGLFDIRGDRVTAVGYEPSPEAAGDFYLFDGILRAGLNYASGQGVELGFLPEGFREANAAYFARLNYPPEPELNIVNFFKKYKNCTTI
jgi:hypothetical protein